MNLLLTGPRGVGKSTVIDRTLALLPYERDAAIVSNIMQAGLPAVRADVLAGRKLGRL